MHEGAGTLVLRHAPAPNDDLIYQGLLKGQAYLHSFGVTGWQDAIVDATSHYRNYDAYLTAAGRGGLPGRGVCAVWWGRMEGVEEIEGRVAVRAGGAGGP